MAAEDAGGAADRVVVTYRAADADPASAGGGLPENHLVHERIRDRPFRAYFRRAHGGAVAVGDEWQEFVNCGCGSTTDVALRVESVDGGEAIGDDTAIDLVAADA